jgi:hypothetical protein
MPGRGHPTFLDASARAPGRDVSEDAIMALEDLWI